MRKVATFIFFAILLLGFLLRAHNLTTWPRLGATFDEYAWTWQGMNIIQHGIPTSWSPLPAYTNFKNTKYQTVPFRLVTPYLEHPPLFGLVAGSFALLNGAKNMYDVDISNIRQLALLLGVLSIGMVFLYASSLFGRRIGIIASLLYATIPTVVVGSRIVQNENFFIPVWFLSLWFIAKYFNTKKPIWRNMGILLASALILAKIPWGAASLSLIFLFISQKKYKDALYAFVGAVIAVGLYVVYGFYYDGGLFMELLRFQSARYDITFNSIFALFQKPYLADRFYTDGWIYMGWLIFPLLFLKDNKKYLFIILPMLSYFLVFLAGIPDEAGHGWYRYPFYPFLVISLALFIPEYFRKNAPLTFLFLVFIGTSLLQNTFGYTFGFSHIIFRLSILSWVIPLLPIFIHKPVLKRFADVVSCAWFGLFILLNIVSVLLYNEQ